MLKFILKVSCICIEVYGILVTNSNTIMINGLIYFLYIVEITY